MVSTKSRPHGAFSNRWVRILIWATWSTAAVVALVAVAVSFEIDNSVSVWFPEDDPALVEYERLQGDFGRREWMVALAESTGSDGNALRDDDLTALVGRWLDLEDVHQVVPAEAVFPRGAATDRAYLLEVTNDLSARTAYREDLVRALRASPAGLTSVGAIRLSGSPVINAELNRAARRDMILFFPLVTLLVALLGRALFGSARDTTVLLVVCLGTVTITQGLLLGLGNPLNMVTIMLPTILIALSVADVVHLVQAFHEARRSGAEGPEAAWLSARKIALPCAGTTLTTAAGFLALSGSSVEPVRQLAMYASGGIVLAWAAAVTIGPLMLARLWREAPPRPSRALSIGRRLLGKWAATIRRRPLLVGLGWAFAAVSVLGLASLEADTDYARFFRDGSAVPSDYRAIQTAGLAQTPVVGVLRRESGSAPALDGAETRAFLEDLTGIGGVGAVVPTPESTPRARRVLLVSDSSNSRHLTSVAEESIRIARNRLPDDLDWHVTGTALLWAHMDEGVIRTQRESLLLVSIACFVIFVLLFRSPLLALIGLGASLLPVAIGLGWMGAFGIPVNMATVLIAGIAVGLAVDDSIHLLHAFRQARRRGRSIDDAVHESVLGVGLRMIVTTAVLVGAFSILALSNFVPTAHFGLFSSLTIVVALLADLTLLPAALRLCGGAGVARPTAEHTRQEASA